MTESNDRPSSESIPQLERWVDGVRAACAEAREAILEIYENDDFDVEMKADDSPLTRADLASHRILVAALERLTPDIPVLSEESASTAFQARRGWPRLWVVDPLDGTREFIKRNGEFTINVALVEDHRPVLGVIAVPAQDEVYSGIPGHGAVRWDAAGTPTPIATRRPPADPPVVLGSRSHGNPRSEAYFEAIGRHERLARGSALKFCAVACGEADFYPRLGPTSEWDTAAGDALVHAAGGRVGLPDGRDLRYNARETTLNGDFLVSGDPQANWPTPPPAAD